MSSRCMLAASAFSVMAWASPLLAAPQMERLDRGVVAVRQDEQGVFVGWRLLGDEPADLPFNVYRQTGADAPAKLNEKPLTGATHLVDRAADLTKPTTYTVRPVVDGAEQAAGKPFALPAGTPVRTYLPIKLQTPEGYKPNDASAADLDGDGQYEIILHQTGRGYDNSRSGPSDPPIFQAYKLDGTLLWTINLGKNIREGAHYTQFLVYDFDGDGRAEMICKTSDGTTDGAGKVMGDANATHANPNGHVLAGPEWLTVFDGRTGAAIDTIPYVPARTNNHPEKPDMAEYRSLWGDTNGNRGERYLAAVAYLDGERASAVMCRGYYGRSALWAVDFDGKKLQQRWLFDTGPDRANPYFGQGNHNLSVADVDDDGKDEIVYGGCVIDDDGKGLFSTGYGHADAIHVGDLVPANPGLEMFRIQERFADAGAHMVALKTGKTLWKKASQKADETGGDRGEGPGRGMAADVDAKHPGAESWALGAQMTGMWNAAGEQIATTQPTMTLHAGEQTFGTLDTTDADRERSTCNFRIYWDGDLLDELLDKTQILKWDPENLHTTALLDARECTSNSGSKSTPTLSADLFGDWREEVIWPTKDGSELRIYTTTIPTEHRFHTLMHDPQYRLSIAWQNVAYNQPPHVGWDLSSGKQAKPKIRIAAP